MFQHETILSVDFQIYSMSQAIAGNLVINFHSACIDVMAHLGSPKEKKKLWALTEIPTNHSQK